jgi:hypothetical protein
MFRAKGQIFALNGMVGRAAVIGKLQPGFPDPDYGKDVAQVYQEATIWALARQKELSFLYLAVMSSSELSETSATVELPSWVPDFGRLTTVPRRGVPTLTFHSLGPWEAFIASPDPTKDLSVQLQGSDLQLNGVFCDYIKNVSLEIPYLAPGLISEEDPNAAVPWILNASLVLLDFFSQETSRVDESRTKSSAYSRSSPTTG